MRNFNLNQLREMTMTIKEIAEMNLQNIQEVLKNYPPNDGRIVIADYTAEEFAELKKGEDFQQFSQIRRIVVDRLKELGIVDKVILHKIDSVKYYQFLAERGFTHSQKALAAFADIDFRKGEEKK